LNKQRVLALQHVEINPPGLVGEILHENNIPYDIVQVTTEALPHPASYNAIFIFGGTQHIYNTEQYPWLKQEEEMVRQAVASGVPVIGICLGSQIIANAFGARVVPVPPVKIGFLQIHFTEHGAADPLFARLPGYQQAFQWHTDVFRLPRGATLLAGHGLNEHQAFRYHQHVYGLQYHIELTPDMLSHWLHDEDSKAEFIQYRGIDAYNTVINEVPSLYPIYREHARTVIQNFLHISGLLA